MTTHLRGHGLRAARVAWLAIAVMTVGLFVVGMVRRYATIAPRIEAARPELARYGLSAGFYLAYSTALLITLAVSFFALAALIVRRRPEEPMALFCSVTLLTLGGSIATPPLWSLHPALGWAGAVRDYLAWTAIILFFCLFPDGRFVPRWAAPLAVAWAALCIPLAFFPDSPLGAPGRFAPLTLVLSVGFLGAGVAAQAHRHRRVSGPVQRQQAKWVVFGFATGIGALVVHTWLRGLFPVIDRAESLASLITLTVLIPLVLLMPATLAVAVLRYRLWDIDPILNRTLVYGALTLSVVGLYALIVGYLGALSGTRGNFAVSLVATGLVAVLFQPLRERLQRGVNRLLYGERDEPYAAISRLGQRLEVSLAPDAVLPAIVETVAQALKVPYAAIALSGAGDEDTVATASAPPPDAPLRLPLVYQHETVGTLLLAPRAPGEPFSPADRRLLDDLARQAGVAAHAVRLTADLQRARERLVLAREEERRRLRRDLHDGLGPVLGSQALTIDAVRALMAIDPAAADRLLVDLKAQTQAAVADIRRLVYNLRPPALDDLGLVPALRKGTEQYQQAGVRVTVEAPDPLPPLPAAVEVAAYRIAQEALTNVVRHAKATACAVRLSFAPPGERPALCLDVADDGRGLPPDALAGVGLASMRERATELGGSCTVESLPGGGTRVSARLPLGKGVGDRG